MKILIIQILLLPIFSGCTTNDPESNGAPDTGLDNDAGHVVDNDAGHAVDSGNTGDAGCSDAGDAAAPACDAPAAYEPGDCSIDHAECWHEDAVADGATCSSDDDCATGSCDQDAGLCTCVQDEDCNDGICGYGGICGPSWCNGSFACSLLGPYCVFSDEAARACDKNGKKCVEGDYPSCPNYGARGYCE